MQQLHTYTGHKNPIYALCNGRSPSTFLSGGGDGKVVEWSTEGTDEGTLLVTVSKAIFSMHLLPDQRTLLIGNEHGGLHVIDLEAKKEVQFFEVHTKGIFDMVRLADDRVACSGGDGSLSLWDTGSATLKLYRQIPLGEDKLRGMAIHADGTFLAIGSSDGSIRIVDTAVFNEHYTVSAHKGGTMCAAYHPSKPVLISGGKDGHLRTWHTGEGYRAIHSVPAHSGTIYAIKFSPDGLVCATVGRDKLLKLWDSATFDPIERMDIQTERHTHSVNCALWTGGKLVTGSDDRTVRIWQ